MRLNKVEICGVNTSKLKTLTDKEKRDLLERSHDGDKAARDELISGNLRLVLSIVQRFSSRGEDPDDLFQVGCVGLIKSIDNFDLTQDVKFSTYAVPMIIGEIRRFLRDNSLVRVSRSTRDLAYRALTAREELSHTLDREPTADDIANKLGEPRAEVVAALDAIVDPVSLYEPVWSDNGDSIYVMDQISDKKNKEEKWVENIVLNEALKGLSERERKIIDMRFFNGKTQMEIADEIGISQAQVSRLEKNALKAMKKYME